MKIVLPVGDNHGVDSEVFGHFGSAPFFRNI
jgi:predicted Fe-Mo cluster-binding NifX family protein